MAIQRFYGINNIYLQKAFGRISVALRLFVECSGVTTVLSKRPECYPNFWTHPVSFKSPTKCFICQVHLYWLFFFWEKTYTFLAHLAERSDALVSPHDLSVAVLGVGFFTNPRHWWPPPGGATLRPRDVSLGSLKQPSSPRCRIN